MGWCAHRCSGKARLLCGHWFCCRRSLKRSWEQSLWYCWKENWTSNYAISISPRPENGLCLANPLRTMVSVRGNWWANVLPVIMEWYRCKLTHHIYISPSWCSRLHDHEWDRIMFYNSYGDLGMILGLTIARYAGFQGAKSLFSLTVIYIMYSWLPNNWRIRLASECSIPSQRISKRYHQIFRSCSRPLQWWI